MIIRQEVENSTAIAAFEYNTETEILSIQFMSGGTYDYPDVPEHIVMEWMNAESMGKYFNKEIRRYAV